MKNIFQFFSSIVILLIVTSNINAQEQEEPKSAAELAKELANPNATLGTMAFPIDFVMFNGDLPDANKQYSTSINFQPSLPVSLAKGVNLFIRPFIPLILSQPYYGENGFEQKGINLGNISADVAVGKTWPSKTITILGVFAGFPTATDKDIRTSEVTIGPELMVAQLFNWGAIGVMVNHAWGLSGKTDDEVDGDEFSIMNNIPRHASITAGQYFYVINLKNAWQITGQPTWAYNHNADKGSKFTFPVGTGVNKVMKLGKLPIKFTFQYWYYVAAPESFGPQHQFRFQIAPVIPLPW